MRKLNRETLSAEATAFLDARSEQVRVATDRSEEAQRLWKLQNNAAFREVRETLKSMTSGLGYCMYCEYSEATDIEHFWPKSAYPDKAFTWTNYLLACSGCNSNHKRDQFPMDPEGIPLLIDPTAEDPRAHLVLSVITGEYTPRVQGGLASAKGQASINVFGLSRDILEKGRRSAWVVLQALLLRYDDARSREDWPAVSDLKETLSTQPFSSVFVAFLDIVDGNAAPLFVKMRRLDARCLGVIEKYPDIKGWV